MKKLNFIVIVAITAGLSIPAFAGGKGNGSGYGGPDLAAEVIPPEFNGITYWDIEKAAKVCMLEGNLNHGVVSLAQRIVQTLYPDQEIQKVQGPQGEPIIDSAYAANNQTLAEWQDATARSLMNTGNEIGITLELSYGPTVRCSGPLPEIGNSGNCFANGPAGFKGNLRLSTPSFWSFNSVELPDYHGKRLSLSFVSPQGQAPGKIEDHIILSYKEMNYLPKFDRFGRVESSTLTFDGVKVRTDMPVIRFANKTTGRPLDLYLSQTEAVRCMSTELQKAAK